MKRLLLVLAVMCLGLNFVNAQCPLPEIAPWTETFTTTVDPPCWSQSSTTGGPWVYTGNPGYDVSGTLDHTNGVTNNYSWIDFSSTDVGVILTTPEINVNALTVPELRFWEVSHYQSGSLGTYNLLYVEASDGLGGWNQVAVYQGETGAAWVEHTSILSTYTYTVGPDTFVQLRFRAESGGDINDFWNDLLLDDVSVVEAPTCPQPIDLQVDSSDLTTASFSWTPTGSETQWFLEYGPVGFTPGTGTTAPLTTPNPWDQITGLTSNSFYDVYVRAYCSPGDTSWYTGPVGFNTFNMGQFIEYDNDCGPGFTDITATGTATGFTDDAELGLALPFSFYFDGTLVTDVTIAENGVLVLGNQFANITWSNQPIASAPENGVYAWWDDLDTDWGDVYYETVGTPGNQQFIVQYQDKNYFVGPAGEVITFEIILDEASGEIWVVYPDTEFGGSDAFADNGASATLGVQGPTQNVQVSYNNAAYLQNNSCVHYYYTDCPVPANYAVTYVTADEGAITWSAGLAGEANWTVLYGLAGFDPTNPAEYTEVQTGTPALIMPGLDDITCYDVYIFADCSGSLQSNSLFGTFCTLPNCANPSGIGTATAVDTVMTGWTWVENVGYPSTGFGIEYGWQGFTQGSGTVSWLDNNYTDTTADASLIAGGVYDIYVQAVCGTDSSAWIGPVPFTMPLTNDSTCFAEDLAVDGTMYTFDNSGATVDAGELGIVPPATGYQTQNGWGNSNLNSSVWYTFVAPPSGNVRVNCAGINFDGQVAAYEVTDCNDFNTYTLLGANDDAPGGYNPPLMNVCGLTPGNVYYLMYDSWSTTAQGPYNITLTEVVVEAGTDNGLVDVCLGDTVNLFGNIGGNDAGGVWHEQIPTANFTDSLFITSGLASQVFYFDYVVTDGCAVDSVETSVEIYAPSSAGIDGSIVVCMNQPINLMSGLSGNVDFGGQWYDPSNSPTAQDIVASSIPGQFNYDYITGNGVCPDDTANVIVDVQFDCDYLNLQEIYFEGMDVYPNPTTGMIYISNNGSEEVYNIELTDLNGKVINTVKNAINGTETTEFNVEDLETGIYLIRVFNNNAEKTFRIVKQ